MGVLGDFFLAVPGETPTYDFSAWADEDRVECKRVTPLEAAELLAVLRDVPDGVPLIDDFPLVTGEDADEWTFGTPEDFAERLTVLDEDDVERVATAFSERTDEELGWPVGECIALVGELRDLAVRGAKSGRAIYFWNSL